MYQQIQETMGRATIPPTRSYLRWEVCFFNIVSIVGVKGYLEDKNFCLFDVDNTIIVSIVGNGNCLSLCYRTQNNSNRIR